MRGSAYWISRQHLQKIWSDDTLDINIRLFIAYIVEERMRAFGDRWMAEGEIENIRQWESKNTLDSTLSNNYGSCLEFFVQNELVYASSWTSYGNPREYTLFPSLQELLFNCPHKIMEELQKVKDAYHLDLPFWVLRSPASRQTARCWASYLIPFLS